MPSLSPNHSHQLRTKYLEGLTTQAHPCIWSAIGIPGAGKSTFIDKALKDGTFPKDAYLMNPDRLMNDCPEYLMDKDHLGTGKALEKWEISLRDLTYDLFEEAVTNRYNIIKDMGCTRQEDLTDFIKLKTLGYKIHLFYLPIELELAVLRCQQDDKAISASRIKERHERLQKLLPDLEDISDYFVIVK